MKFVLANVFTYNISWCEPSYEEYGAEKEKSGFHKFIKMRWAHWNSSYENILGWPSATTHINLHQNYESAGNQTTFNIN